MIFLKVLNGEGVLKGHNFEFRSRYFRSGVSVAIEAEMKVPIEGGVDVLNGMNISCRMRKILQFEF